MRVGGAGDSLGCGWYLCSLNLAWGSGVVKCLILGTMDH